MRTGMIALLAAGFLFAVPLAAAGDVDLTVTDVNVVWVGGGYYQIEAEVTFAANAYHDGFVTDVEFEVDGQVQTGVTIEFGPFDPSGGVDPRCNTDLPPCEGWCPPIVYNGEVITSYFCTDWFSQPDNCSCVYLVVTPPIQELTYEGQLECGATVDPHGQVAESDETNNTMYAQIDPPPNIDFEATHCNVSWNGNEFMVEVEIQTSVQGEHAGFYTDVGFHFSNGEVSTVVFDADAFGPNPSIKCEDTYPACDGLCKPTLINNQIVNGSCTSWFFEDKCGCIYLVAKCPGPIEYTDQNTCEIYVDDSNSVAEADETNNHLYCEIGTTAVESLSWSMIKALYR